MVPLFTSRYSVGIKNGRQKAYEIIKTVREEFEGIPLHVLGAGGALTPILIGLGVDSIDTTGWIKKAAFGCVIFTGVSDRFFRIERSKKHPNGRTTIFNDPIALEKWENCTCGGCTYLNNKWGKNQRYKLMARKSNTAARKYRGI